MIKKLIRLNEALFLIIIIAVFLTALAPVSAQIAEIVFSAPWGDADDEIGLIDQPEMEQCGPLTFCTDQGGIFLLDSVRNRLLSVESNGKFKVAVKNVAGSAICADGKGGAFVQNEDQIVHIGAKGEKKGNFQIPAQAGKPAQLIEGYGNELFIDSRGEASLRQVNQKIHKIPGAQGAKRFQSSVPGDALDFQIKRMLKNEVWIIGFDDKGKDLVSVTIEIDDGEAGAVLYKGMDDKGNLYVEVENMKGEKPFLEIHRYSQTGERLAVIDLSNDYFTTVYKKTEVAQDGSVYQMLTTREGVRILRYGRED